MQFHLQLIDDPTAAEQRQQSRDAHWQYFDDHVGHFIARGATFTDDRETFLSSVLFVEFDGWDEVRAFIASEPNNLNGVYKNVIIRRWDNALGRLQRDFERREELIPWYFRGYGKPDTHKKRTALLPAHLEYFRDYDDTRFIVRGAIWDDDGEEWQGSANLICLPDRGAAEAFVENEPFYAAGLYEDVLIQRYNFGGRPGQVT